MKIQEYQAKKLFSDYEIPVDKSFLCYNEEEAVHVYKQLNLQKVVIKAQVLTGGRGKAGGVKIAHTEQELRSYVQSILGMNIKGFIVDRILVGEVVEIKSEYYLSIVVDRNTKSPVLVLSCEGGIDIEEVAQNKPERIIRIIIKKTIGIPDFLARRAAFILFNEMTHVKQVSNIIQKLYRLFIEKDAFLVEINPLVLTADDKIMAVDAKVNVDDNALYRHPEIEALNEPSPEEQKEIYAKRKGFSYISLDGDIGCMVNGAGLAMATMDMIKLYGGKPANFLDIGGSSSPDKVVEAMKLLLEDSNVRVVLINIFGGITRCDDVATGLILALEQIKTDIPIVIRLTGTNEHEGRALLKQTSFHIAESMEEATQLAINL